MSKLWEVMIGIAGLGLFSAMLMKELPLHTAKDEKWGLKEGSDKQKEREQGDTTVVPEDLEKGTSEVDIHGLQHD